MKKIYGDNLKRAIVGIEFRDGTKTTLDFDHRFVVGEIIRRAKDLEPKDVIFYRGSFRTITYLFIQE